MTTIAVTMTCGVHKPLLKSFKIDVGSEMSTGGCMHFRGHSSSSIYQGSQSRRKALQISSEPLGNYISGGPISKMRRGRPDRGFAGEEKRRILRPLTFWSLKIGYWDP